MKILNDSRAVCILRDMFCFSGLNCSQSFRNARCVDYARLTAVIKHNLTKTKK